MVTAKQLGALKSSPCFGFNYISAEQNREVKLPLTSIHVQNSDFSLKAGQLQTGIVCHLSLSHTLNIHEAQRIFQVPSGLPCAI